MKRGEDKPIHELREDDRKPSSPVDEEDLFSGKEKMAPDEMKEYMDDLFHSYIFGKG